MESNNLKDTIPDSGDVCSADFTGDTKLPSEDLNSSLTTSTETGNKVINF